MNQRRYDNNIKGRSRKKQHKNHAAFFVILFIIVLLVVLAALGLWYNKNHIMDGGDMTRAVSEMPESSVETTADQIDFDEPNESFVFQVQEKDDDTDEIDAEPETMDPVEEQKNALLAEGYTELNQADPDLVSFAFAGDILFDESYAVMASLLQRTGGHPDLNQAFDSALIDQMKSADIFMINNEFPYSRGGAPKEGKTFTFRARPEYAELMHQIGVDLVSLANNHINDYGQSAMLDTFAALENAGVPYVGAGRNIEEASKPVLYTNGEVKFAVFSATQIERMGNPDTVGAGENSPGVFRCFNIEKLLEGVRNAKEDGNIVIVYIHWGTESTENIDEWQLKQAKQLAEAGVDLIIGDHPHILQRIDVVSGVPVVYSLGNYWFNSKTLDTCLFRADFDAHDGTIRNLQFVPALQSGCRTKLALGSEADRIISHMREMSPHVDIQSDGTILLNK